MGKLQLPEKSLRMNNFEKINKLEETHLKIAIDRSSVRKEFDNNNNNRVYFVKNIYII